MRMSSSLRFATFVLIAWFSFLFVSVNFTHAASSTLACPNITRMLKRGSSGEEVRRLQIFLAQDPGVYPEGQVTGSFGPLTEMAVKRWQAKFNIITSGSAATTGFGAVGAGTIAEMARQCAGAPGVASRAAPSTGGLLSVTPIAGNSPLTVTIQAVVNTANVCGGAMYNIDYGDGTIQSQIPVPAGNCGQITKSFSHTYRNRGTFTISLAAGSHRTSVTVNVR